MHLETARQLADKGFHVFPLAAGTKIPKRGSRGFKDAVNSGVENLDWDYSNVGISTGKFNGSGALVVLDVDCKNGKDGNHTLAKLLEEKGVTLPETYEQKTPSGGHHYIYRYKKALKSGESLLGSGLDVKSEGGYIVAAPSIVSNGAYTSIEREIAECPQWIVDILEALDQEDLKPKQNFMSLVQDINPADAHRDAVEYLRVQIPAVPGERNSRGLRAAMKLKDLGVNHDDAFDIMSEHWICEPALDESELKHVIDSAWRYGKNSPGAYAPGLAFDSVSEQERNVGAAKLADNSQSRKRLYLEKSKDCLPILDQPFLVEDCLPPGGFSVMWGKSNTGKTFIALDLAYKIALGLPWHGRRVQSGPVVYVAAEAGKSIRNRIHGFNLHYDLVGKDAPIGIVPCSVDLYRPDADIKDLISLISSFNQKPAFIVIDTLARVLAGGNENDSSDMGRLVAHIDAIRAVTGAHVMLVHHAGKSGGIRGSSSLECAIDTELEVSASFSIKIGKNREYARDSRPLGFQLKVVEIGIGSGMKQITSCVVTEMGEVDDMPEMELKRSDELLNAIQLLPGVFLERGHVAPKRWKLEDGAYFVTIKEWRTAYMQKYMPDGTRHQQSYAWKQVLEEFKLEPGKYKIVESEDVVVKY